MSRLLASVDERDGVRYLEACEPRERADKHGRRVVFMCAWTSTIGEDPETVTRVLEILSGAMES